MEQASRQTAAIRLEDPAGPGHRSVFGGWVVKGRPRKALWVKMCKMFSPSHTMELVPGDFFPCVIASLATGTVSLQTK